MGTHAHSLSGRCLVLSCLALPWRRHQLRRVGRQPREPVQVRQVRQRDAAARARQAGGCVRSLSTQYSRVPGSAPIVPFGLLSAPIVRTLRRISLIGARDQATSSQDPPTSAPGLNRLSAHICAGTEGLPPPTSALGLRGSPRPHLRGDMPQVLHAVRARARAAELQGRRRARAHVPAVRVPGPADHDGQRQGDARVPVRPPLLLSTLQFVPGGTATAPKVTFGTPRVPARPPHTSDNCDPRGARTPRCSLPPPTPAPRGPAPATSARDLSSPTAAPINRALRFVGRRWCHTHGPRAEIEDGSAEVRAWGPVPRLSRAHRPAQRGASGWLRVRRSPSERRGA